MFEPWIQVVINVINVADDALAAELLPLIMSFLIFKNCTVYLWVLLDDVFFHTDVCAGFSFGNKLVKEWLRFLDKGFQLVLVLQLVNSRHDIRLVGLQEAWETFLVNDEGSGLVA